MIQELMRQALVDFKASMEWSDKATEHEKALVLGNLNGFANLLEARTAALESTVEAMAKALESIAKWTQEQQDEAEAKGFGVALWRGCVAEARAALASYRSLTGKQK